MQRMTRARPEADRIACRCPIKPFVDPDAAFFYVPAPEILAVAERTGAIPRDVPGIELGHHGAECCFDAMLARYGLNDPSLRRLALESPSLEATAEELRHLYDDDHAQLAVADGTRTPRLIG